MKIIGHRGARGLAPENTLAGVRRGIAAHADMIEIDVRLLGDKIVLSHDSLVSGEKYTSLIEVLSYLHDKKVPLNIEVKEIEVVPYLKETIKGYKVSLVFSSFDFKTLQLIKKLLPNAKLAVLEKWSGIRAIAEASILGTNRVHINQQWLWSGFVRSMKHRGFDLYAYTVNSRDRAEELEKWGVDGIFTDYPSLFAK
jgi:glycerophosphoryl diester phosphodiesterase